SNFWYLTGIDEPDVILVLDKDKEYLILPERDEVHATFDGSLDTESISKQSGISMVLDHKTGWKQLGSRLKRVKHIATLAAMPGYIERYGLYTNPARKRLIRQLKKLAPDAEMLDLRPHLTRMRMTKQPHELAAIETAIRITSATLKEVVRKL